MISDNQMDEFFNGRFRDYPSAVPEDMWDRIIEKKKRDRMFWLFFPRLFAIVILSLALVGGYFIINQKKSASVIGMDSTKINHAAVIADINKSSESNLHAHQDQVKIPQKNEVNKQTSQKKKIQIVYVNEFDHAKKNYQHDEASSNFNNLSKIQSGQTKPATPTDSSALKENSKEDKKDSSGKKPFVKAAAPFMKATTPDSTQNKDSKKSEIKNKSNNPKWFLDLYASPDYPFVSPPPEDEQSKLSYAIGIKLNRSLGKHFSIKTGIQYSQVIIIGDSVGSPENPLQLKRLDLPVLAGYSMGKENLKTTINGGFIFNLYTWPHGFFKTNTGVSLYLGVNFEEKVSDKFSLFAEPYYRYQLTNMTADTISILKFIDVVGINLGVRYYFKKKHSGK
ncbi:MAG TPA: hypothetical protein VNW49_12940 [Puia sp.]|nr:hypothetical protein [Puia sp.]